MRLWSLHPKHLDAKGLVALWREGLLALAVLKGRTKGYTHHPQLERFRSQNDPVAALQYFLLEIHRAATERGYHFDIGRLGPIPLCIRCDHLIAVTTGQLEFEALHLLNKLKRRAPVLAQEFDPSKIAAHPIFIVRPGPIENWEKIESQETLPSQGNNN